MNILPFMRTYILNMKHESFSRGMKKQVTMQESSAKKPAPTKKEEARGNGGVGDTSIYRRAVGS